MNAVLIDPENRAVTDVEWDGKLHQIYALTQCQCIDAVRTLGHTLYVDDEGLLKSGPKHFFVISGYPQPLAGRALLVGGPDDEGNDLPATLDADAVRGRVVWWR